MRIHQDSIRNMFCLQMQNPMQKTLGQVQNSGLEQIIQRVNAGYRSNCDTVELSPKALDLLQTAGCGKAAAAGKTVSGYPKYPAGTFSREEWAENAVSAQRDGIQTVSDVIDRAKSRLQFTMSRISELESYLNGTHSDPDLTEELAETYLHNYRQSIQSDYTDVIQSHLNPHRTAAEEYDRLSGGLASTVLENQLDSISAESLGLSGLSGDPQEIMKALERASGILDGMKQNTEAAWRELTGGRPFAGPPQSTSVFDGNSSLDFFASRMEQSHRLIDTANMKLTGETLRFQSP